MFYSQFILAKKGPLGTIWIAAHLERKLRKNQVADTDIGVSVDSILFPEVPIALRLSSHLLLGVVRIYSRKVNYLFHDCSEALLKIKQAFRSTAVDLPPEESTAPYHSITLPETFDLDDFELPDTAFNGNFVDHHVSTREQITLQDPMDGTGYSTSQFGLDERFGDGDASQIGLDLDEELFLDKNLSPQHASLGSEEGAVHHSELSTHITNMDIDEGRTGYDEDNNAETPKDLSELFNDRDKHVPNMEDLNRSDYSSHRLVFNIRTPDLNEVFLPAHHMDVPSPIPGRIGIDFAADEPTSPDLIDSAHVPSTPGLLDEAIPANVQEIPALSPRGKFSPSTTVEVNKTDISMGPLLEFEGPDPTNNNALVHAAPVDPKLVNITRVGSSPTSVLTEPKLGSVAPQCSDGILVAPDATNGNGPIHVHMVSSTSVSTEPEPDSLAPQSSGGILAAPDVAHLEFRPKSADNLHSGFICHEASNLPISGQIHDEGEAVLPEAALLVGLVSSSCSHEASNVKTPLANCVADPEGVVVSTNITTDSILVSGMSSDINSTSLEGNTTPNLSNQGRLGDAHSCHTNNVSALSSEFHLRSCSSHSTQTNASSLENMILVENAPGSSSREPHCILETPMREEALISGSSVEVQGDDSRLANVTNTNVGVHQKSNHLSSEFTSCVNKPDDLSTNHLSKDTQLDHLHCFSSSEFSAPEKMLLAPTGDVNLPNDLGQQTIEKGVTESDGSVDMVSSRGQKRRLMDSMPILQNGISSKMSGIPRSGRNTEYIPDDDDLLASILVGRTPALRMGPTPPLPKSASLKRPRLTPRAGMPKRRKVLLDDTMVLHADAIRQQLINTEDIRRMRKKVPCTRPEIWRIQKSSIEDDIFSESILTGISAELNSLQFRRYDLNENLGSQINDRHFSDELSKEMELSRSLEFELSRSLEFVREAGGQEMVEQISAMPDKVDGQMKGPSGTSVLIELPSWRDAQEQSESLLQHRLGPSGNNQTYVVSTIEMDVHESAGVELPIQSVSRSGIECGIPTASRIEETFIHENNKTDASPETCDDKCINQEQQSLNNNLHVAESASVDDFTFAEDAAGERVVDSTTLAAASGETQLHAADACNVQNVFSREEGMGVDMVDAEIIERPEDHANVALIESGGASVSILDSFVLEGGADFPAVEGEIVLEKVLVAEGRPISEVVCAERPQASSSPGQHYTENEHVPSAVGENSGMQEFNLDSGLDVESTPMDFAAVRDSSDFCSAVDGNDTEFLIVDDEADCDLEADNDLPNPEEAQSLENSGWSSRTRGVARYLKAMFDEESGRGRKVVAIDHLLAGKTRKEASRMFFETLVLKTKDYIHVEQENSFYCINIKPRIKLLKSEF